MKFLTKYGTYIAIALLLLAFVLTISAPAVIYHYTSYYVGSNSVSYIGRICIFGSKDAGLKATFIGILIYFFGFIDIVAFMAKYVLPLFGVHALDKFSSIIDIGAAALMFLNGIFSFCIVGAFVSANGATPYAKNFSIGAGWVFAALFYLAGAALILVPMIMKMSGNKAPQESPENEESKE